ncbi:hypothetical protein L1887_31900 [Cichorium endivia]|nr:hypothetical protein L1887_31900 [Cichorium endivia]
MVLADFADLDFVNIDLRSDNQINLWVEYNGLTGVRYFRNCTALPLNPLHSSPLLHSPQQQTLAPPAPPLFRHKRQSVYPTGFLIR